MDEFYVVLPSNNTTSEVNTPSKYITTFDEPIYLDSTYEWEVGLIELIFKNSIKTINNDYALMQNTFAYDTNLPVNISKGEFSYTNTELLENFKMNKYCKTQYPSWIGVQAEWLVNFEMDKYCKSKYSGWIGVQVQESKKLLYCKTEKDNTYFTFNFKNLKVVLKNTSKFLLTLTIPKIIAIFFGFEKMPLNHENKIDIDNMLNQTYTFKALKMNEEISSTQPVIWTYENKQYIIITPKTDKPLYYNMKFEQYNITTESKLILQQGTYTNAEKLEKELNKNKIISSLFTFKYDEKVNRFNLISNKEDSILKMYNGLNDVLGFKNKEFPYKSEPYIGEMEVSLMRGINTIFLYCDCCKYIRVGNTQAPLLRCIPLTSKVYGETVHLKYNNPMYIKVNKTFIDKIEIMLCDAAGSIIPFSEGLTIVILHFKRL